MPKHNLFVVCMPTATCLEPAMGDSCCIVSSGCVKHAVQTEVHLGVLQALMGRHDGRDLNGIEMDYTEDADYQVGGQRVINDFDEFKGGAGWNSKGGGVDEQYDQQQLVGAVY